MNPFPVEKDNGTKNVWNMAIWGFESIDHQQQLSMLSQQNVWQKDVIRGLVNSIVVDIQREFSQLLSNVKNTSVPYFEATPSSCSLPISCMPRQGYCVFGV